MILITFVTEHKNITKVTINTIKNAIVIQHITKVIYYISYKKQVFLKIFDDLEVLQAQPKIAKVLIKINIKLNSRQHT